VLSARLREAPFHPPKAGSVPAAPRDDARAVADEGGDHRHDSNVHPELGQAEETRDDQQTAFDG